MTVRLTSGNLARRAQELVDAARTRQPHSAPVQAAADSVEAALGPVHGWRDRDWSGNSICPRLEDSDSAIDRVLRWNLAGCDAWVARLRAQLPALEAALAAAGDQQLAAITDGLADELDGTVIEQNRIEGSPATWWETLPPAVKIGAGALGVWLVLDVWSKLR